MDYKINIPKNVAKILEVLNQNGYEAYIVGGCVRDSILNREPNDFDITTNAKPENVIELFDKVILTGLQHGTVTVVLENENFEITTYRTEGKYIDNRHPSEVQFVSELKEDLARRDFTINAMAYNEQDGLKDYFNGLDDLEHKIIRTVGDPIQRFNEDALRMIRAIRFSSQLNFDIEESTLISIEKLHDNMKNISKERIREEFNKILISNPRKIELLKKTNLLQYIFKDFNKAYYCNIKDYDNDYKLFEHSISGACAVHNDVKMRLAMLFMDYNKINLDTNDNEIVRNEFDSPQCDIKSMKNEFDSPQYDIDTIRNELKNLRYDNETIKSVLNLVKYHDAEIDSDYKIKVLLNILGEQCTRDLFKVRYAYESTLNNPYAQGEAQNILTALENLNRIIDSGECYSSKKLNINGRDLMEIGVSKGKEIGEILDYVLNEVMKDNNLNDKKLLLKTAQEKLNYKGK